jgi:hypothetical protein
MKKESMKILGGGLLVCVVAFATLGMAVNCIGQNSIAVPKVIAVGEKPNPEEEFAASQVSIYLQKMSGAEFKIVKEQDLTAGTPAIYLGRTKFAAANTPKDLASEEWLVKTAGDNLIITGGLPRGVLYATWEFLEKLGYAWVTRDAELIPKVKNLTFAGELRGQPGIRLRNLYTAFHEQGWGYNKETQEAEMLFRQRNRMNSFGYIGEAKFGGGDYMRPMRNSHTADSYYCSFKDYFKSNPEFFAMLKDGKRFDGTHSTSFAGQLCYSSEGARQVVLKKLKETIAEAYAQADKAGLPRPWLYDISQADNNDWCQCPQCRELIEKEGANSATLLTFINAIAADIEKEYPDVYITTFAYMPTVKPPKTIKARQNVVIRWIDWGGFSLSPDTSKPLRTQKERAENLIAWSKISPKLAVWDYGLGNRPAKIPYNPVPILADDLKFYAEVGVQAFFLESEEKEPWLEDNFKPLYDYMALRLMVKPQLPVSGEVDKFMQAYYGPAAKSMLELYKYLEAKQQELPEQKIISNNARMIPYNSVDFYQTVFKYLKNAEAAVNVPENKTYLRHVRREFLLPCLSLLENWDILEKQTSRSFLEDGRDAQGKHRQDACATTPLPFDRTKLIEQLKLAVADVLSAYPEKIRTKIQATFTAKLNLTANPLPLPEEFSKLPKESVVDLFGEAITGYGMSPLVTDPDSKTGFGLRLPKDAFDRYGTNPKFGIYDTATKAYGPSLTVDFPPQDGKYHLYKLGRYTLINSSASIYGHGSWFIGIKIGQNYDQAAGDAHNTYDVYVSAKLTGPDYINKSKESENGFWVDRVIMVRGGDAK